MTQLTKLIVTAIIPAAIIFTSCDPGHHGIIIVKNESAEVLKLIYSSRSIRIPDDTTVFLQPYTSQNILSFGGLGEGRDIDCCPCELKTITVQPVDTTKTILKSTTDENNWTLHNPNEKRFSNKEINCVFAITQGDIQ